MSCTELFLLIDERGGREQRPDLIGLMPDNNINMRRHCLRRAVDVFDQCVSAHPVQDLGFAGLHPGSFSRGQNQDLQVLH
jgi:hypothetical protein